ncbi:hypothetical protein NODU109028_11840 [Nocardioides dubius]|uniref:Uncharacterized protein n=1 Tax=Nocardioides dubius TaxID=317019 RepID=A0ABP4ECA9_9ACTN
MLPGPFHRVHRSRPLQLVADLPPGADPRPRCHAVEVACEGSATVVAGFTDGAHRIEGWHDLETGHTGLDLVDADGVRTTHRSRRSGRSPHSAVRVGVTVTGDQATVLTHDGRAWTARARAPLPAELGDALRVHSNAAIRAQGRFGQLGVRDLHLVTHDDGTPFTRDGWAFLTLTHAGPGFFGTAHCGVWAFDPLSHRLEHRATLWFERDGAVHGDHAVHLVRHRDRWLLATSTWGDFDHDDVGIAWGSSEADLLAGEHVVPTVPLDLDDAVRGVGAWDPHLTLIDGHWHLALVVASEFFVFGPALLRARRPDALSDWELLGEAEGRTASEGTQILRLDDEWRVLASDGPDSAPALRRRFPVFDLTMREVGTLVALYPSNLPWPTLLEVDDGWLMLTFDGTPTAGRVAGYGTHGDFLVLSTNPARARARAGSGAGELL